MVAAAATTTAARTIATEEGVVEKAETVAEVAAVATKT